MHFVPDVAGPNGKAGYLQSITTRLKPGASFFLVLCLHFLPPTKIC
jgi:hypothetical protein